VDPARRTVLLVSEVFPPKRGGSGRWFWELYRRLAGIRVHVAAGQVPGAEAFDRAATLPIDRLPLTLSSWSCWELRSGVQYVRAWWHLTRLVSRIQPDVLHCGKCLPEGLLALTIKRLRGIPFHCYAHGEELTLATTSRQLRHLTARVLAGATGVIANSQFTKDLLIANWGLSPARISVLHPGVDTSQFAPCPSDSSVRARLGWTNRRVVLTVGALQQRKGQDMLIRALPSIRQRVPDVLYVIAGEGWERSRLERLVVENAVADLVQFRDIPADDELVKCYQQCDLFVLPNRQVGWDVEGFGIVLIEAQACGKAVIAGASGGTADTLQPGVTGELVNCEQPEILADAVAGLLLDPGRGRRMAEQARRWTVATFEWNALVPQASELFGQSQSKR
jgi:phosphatidylinositol alpha-1,6-mannosyltransferase